MSTLGYILLFTFLGSIVSLLGGVALLAREKFAIKISHFLASFAAGALLGTAFFDLMPEAAHEAEHLAEETGVDYNIFLWTLVGFLIFFLMERFIHWFHHHHDDSHTKGKPIVALVTFGDAVHNFIDGIAIAATFMVSIPLGIVTTFAVAAHEIPQEIGDFGILLHHGVKRGKVLFLNFLSALTAIAGAMLAYFASDSLEGLLPVFLSVTAGFFIYIAAADLIPEIHNEEKKKIAAIESVLLLVGVFTIYFFITLLESSGLAH
jgi:zinc and cadmium transporter